MGTASIWDGEVILGIVLPPTPSHPIPPHPSLAVLGSWLSLSWKGAG